MILEEEEKLPVDFDEKKFNHRFGLIFEGVIGFLLLSAVIIIIFCKIS